MMGRKKKDTGKSPVDSAKKKEQKEIVLMFSAPDPENSPAENKKKADGDANLTAEKKPAAKKGKPIQVVFHF
jgi:hypothetical protein